MSRLTEGDLRRAMHQVAPEVPAIATRYGDSPSQLDENPLAIRDALVECINTGQEKIPDPDEPFAHRNLKKVETYTILDACGIQMHPYMVERDDSGPKFKESILASVSPLSTSLTASIGAMFRTGFDELGDNQPWVYDIQGHYGRVEAEYRRMFKVPDSGVRCLNNGIQPPSILHILV